LICGGNGDNMALELKTDIDEMKKRIEMAEGEIAKAKAAGVDVSASEIELQKLKDELKKLEAAYA